jgi:hypothetical protein
MPSLGHVKYSMDTSLTIELRVGVNVVRAVIWVTIWLQVEETS